MTQGEERIMDTPGGGRIGKQIQLPLSKAVEISVKSLRVRFWRSMLTVSSIILAIAFLTFVWTSSRMQSAVAIGIRPDVARVTEVARRVDEHWKPFEQELAKRFSKRRGEYRRELKWLYDGRTGGFRKYCRLAANHPEPGKRVNLEGLPTDGAVIDSLSEAARRIGLTPDLEGWSHDALKLAGIKGVVQGEVNRMGRLQLALQEGGIDPETPTEKLRKMSPTVIWLIIISLLVCGVGITNAMLMSVTERFREIGTMKCLGALDGFIVKLFLLESVFQGVAGTAFGVAIGFVILMLSSLYAFGTATFEYFPGLEVLSIVLYAIVIGSGLSILAAVFPALRAAHMAPVEAMRVEE